MGRQGEAFPERTPQPGEAFSPVAPAANFGVGAEAPPLNGRTPGRAPENWTLLERAEVIAQIGSWQWYPETDELLWSDNVFRLMGLGPGAIAPTRELALERIHPDDRDRVDRGVQAIVSEGKLAPIEYRSLLPGGATRHLRSTVTSVETGTDGRRVIVGVVQDVTDQRRAEREIAVHIAVAGSLERWNSFERGAERLIGALAEAMGSEVGVLWLPAEGVLVARVFWSASSLDAGEFESATRQLRLSRGVGIPGIVWESMEPLSVSDVLEEPSYRRHDAAAAIGLHGALAFPALHSEEVLAVLEFYYRAEAERNRRQLRTTAAIGYELGQFLAHRRGEIAPSTLTARELEVLELAARGHSGREIAEQLVLAPSTVKTHLQHIYEKLGVCDRASAVAKALRGGLIE